MTDKQIIIDGVDVSGCGFYHSETGTECHIALAFAEEYTDDNHTYLKCEQNPNCSYKQLKRKEQECERLKEGYSELTDIVSPYMDDFTGYNEELGGFDIVLCVKELMEQLDQLKAENEELKEKNRQLTILGMDLNQSNEVLRKSFFATDKSRDYWREQAEKLKQTLIEIKEIAKICKCHNADGCYECKYFDDCEVEDEEIPTRDVCKLILQKISEVVDGN